MKPFPFDGRTWPPNYDAILDWRIETLAMLRADATLMEGARAYYAQHWDRFIDHWMTTYDPRNAGQPGKMAYMPFCLFPKQREYILFIRERLATQTGGLIEKCRDVGLTWLSGAVSVCMWLFVPGAAVGWGSRKEDLVDKLGDPDSIFEKMRILIRMLPKEFRPKGFSVEDHMPFMRIVNPVTGATITGESGDNIGRGGRKLIYFKDESAHYVRPEKIEAALSENTRIQIDISSVNGIGNPFYNRREAGIDWSPMMFIPQEKTAIFVFDWSDHPEKTREWYEKRKKKFFDEGLATVFAQEVDRDYQASISGTIIKKDWIAAAIDADKKLGFKISGGTFAGLDVADGGTDTNACVVRKGVGILSAEDWGEDDTGKTTRRAIKSVEGLGDVELQYDSIGVGAGVKAEYNRLAASDEESWKNLIDRIRFTPWSAAAKVLFPERRLVVVDGVQDKNSPTNEDYFQNLKAQGWWQLARRFERTYRAVVEGIEYDPEDLITIPGDLPNLRRLEKELAQAVFVLSERTGKTMVDKTPDGTKSPNLADATVMAFWPVSKRRLYTLENIGE